MTGLWKWQSIMLASVSGLREFQISSFHQIKQKFTLKWNFRIKRLPHSIQCFRLQQRTRGYWARSLAYTFTSIELNAFFAHLFTFLTISIEMWCFVWMKVESVLMPLPLLLPSPQWHHHLLINSIQVTNNSSIAYNNKNMRFAKQKLWNALCWQLNQSNYRLLCLFHSDVGWDQRKSAWPQENSMAIKRQNACQHSNL